jgi:(p)ppGpp synthase/HD superfamily hydrolase
MDINECKNFMINKHGEQLRKHGTPYFTHPLAVAQLLKEHGFGIDYQIAGLFHDLLEDTDATYEDLVNISNKSVADAVKLVTKEKGYKMPKYIKRISENDIAKMVKLADRINNLSEAHLASVEFRIKYIKETTDWYLDLAKGTCFEKELNEVLEKVKESISTPMQNKPGGHKDRNSDECDR